MLSRGQRLKVVKQLLLRYYCFKAAREFTKCKTYKFVLKFLNGNMAIKVSKSHRCLKWWPFRLEHNFLSTVLKNKVTKSWVCQGLPNLHLEIG